MDSFLNASNESDVILLEFPYWKPTLAITLFVAISVACCTVFVYLLLLVVMFKIKKKHFKPLNIVHISLMISTILDAIIQIFLFAFYVPSIYRYCICSEVLATIYTAEVLFFSVYQPLAFASLGVLQFLTILRKKRLANVKTAFGMIALCIGVSSIFVASTVRLLYESEERTICYESYCPTSRPESGIGLLVTIFIIVFLSSFLPSLAVIIITSIWSCAIFQKYYTGGDDQLNRRMLSLPVVMPLTIIATTVLEAIVVLLVGNILFTLSSGDFLPYWILFTDGQILALFRVFTRVTYPLVLIYTHSDVRQTFKTLFKRPRPGTNSVSPSS